MSALVKFLAARPASSVREVIGVVNRLVAAAEIARKPLTVELAQGELDASAPTMHVPDVQSADLFFLDDEKIVWHMPDIGPRLIEEPI
jgi:chromosomal replication initiation ATPase DnaA